MLRLLAALLLGACADDPPPPADPVAAVARVRATIAEAGRLDGVRQEEEARAAWRRAVDDYTSAVAPALRHQWPDVAVTEVTLRFGLQRAAIERARGGSRSETRDLIARLDDAAAALATPPSAATPSAATP